MNKSKFRVWRPLTKEETEGVEAKAILLNMWYASRMHAFFPTLDAGEHAPVLCADTLEPLTPKDRYMRLEEYSKWVRDNAKV